MRVLVTGIDGYLGCLVAPELLRRGHEVTGVDTGYYRQGWLYNGIDVTAKTLTKDIRHVAVKDLEGFDATVHMAELPNDPQGQLASNIICQVNRKGSIRLANIAIKAGVERFVYMSSCSVYGAPDDTVDETAPINPQTLYAQSKALVERELTDLSSDDFSPTFMRNATAFGASPRQRFDIVLNNLSGLAWTTKKIVMTSDGTPWRPLVHGLDIVRSIY
jgi:nucleoside-diphosphate-sugar epimerase